MTSFSDVPPDTLSVRLTEGGIAVEYLDGREVFYHGVPEQATPPHGTKPGKDVHVLVTDDTETSGILVYVDERATESDILESSGVGRILLDNEERRSLFAGVEATRDNLTYKIDIDDAMIDGRVFVFEEDQFSEHAYELTATEQGDKPSDSDGPVSS
ncbi:DUF5796 family protein [Halovenus rubra]|uniref:DUF5796 family protein n=2 Tax=Halovenus rubra TaxID=869890 RepID=A0ACC7E0N6_9EURY|nr:DUF5796 family protein [Halovenus rubra]